MGFPARYGGISLDTVVFATDPGLYEPLNWKKRYAARKCGGGSTSIQEWGTWIADAQLRLGSGNNLSGSPQILDTDTVSDLQRLYEQQNVTFTLADWLSNQFEVMMADFRPVFFKARDFWTYDMTLVVVSCVQLLGRLYIDGDAGTHSV